MTDKERIIQLFNTNVKGKIPNVSDQNQKHDGKYGHWLEKQFGIPANRNNAPDLLGYELKNQTTSKISFGDWSANYYIFKDDDFSDIFQGRKTEEKRDIFLRIFGHNVTGRYSWSGSPCPKINKYNDFGQVLSISNDNNILAIYSYSQDKRSEKSTIVPIKLQKENLILALWEEKSLQGNLEKKFNQKGWFTCKTDSTGAYNEICFGAPMNYSTWLDLVRKGIVFFDSGMHEGNSRPYSIWRTNNAYWDSLIIERY